MANLGHMVSELTSRNLIYFSVLIILNRHNFRAAILDVTISSWQLEKSESTIIGSASARIL